MAGTFPPEGQTPHGTADTLARDGQRMGLTEVLRQQGRRPHGGTRTQVARITLNYRSAQGRDNSLCRRRTATPGAWGNAHSDGLPFALLKLGDPCIQHLTAHPEAVSHLVRGVTRIEPQQSLDTAELLGITSRDGEAFQGGPLFWPQREERHRRTSWLCE